MGVLIRQRESTSGRVFGADLSAASVPDLIRTKEAANRPQDRQDVILLREILERFGPSGSI